MRRIRQVLAGLALAGFGVALAFAALEVGVRVLHLFPDRFWQPDALLGTRLIPGQRGWWTQEELEFRVPVTINSHGFRDVEHSVTKPEGVVRVLLLGDSFIEAMQVPIDATIGRQLEAQLNAGAAGGRRYEVVSMGVSGYGTASELLTYRTIGRQYAADVVLLAFYPGNDIKNNSATLEDKMPPVYGPGGALERVSSKGQKDEPPRVGLSKLLNSSEAYRFVRKKILTQHPGTAQALARLGVLDRGAMIEIPMRDGVPLDYWVFAASWPPEWQEAWRSTEGLLDELRREVSADGAHLALMVVSSRERVYPETWQTITEANPRMKDNDWDLGAPERKVLQWCNERGVPCLALSPIFAAHNTEGQRLHWLYDGHWTAAGHALAAKTVAEFLREQHLLPSHDATR